MTKRKTAAQRRQEMYDAERDAFRGFVTGINEMNSLGEILVAAQTNERFGPHTETYLSNIVFFLGNFIVPNGATRRELAFYKQLIERLGADLPIRNEILAALDAGLNDRFRRP